MYYTTWSQLLFWDTICTWQYDNIACSQKWRLENWWFIALQHGAESFLIPNPSFPRTFDICIHENGAGWADCRRHRSDLGLPRGGHGARRGQPDLWQLVVYGLPVIVQGRSLPIHNTHHILFQIDCFVRQCFNCSCSPGRWCQPCPPARPRWRSRGRVCPGPVPRTSSPLWSEQRQGIVRGNSVKCLHFPCLKDLKDCLYSMHLLSSFPLGTFLFLLWTKFHRGLCRSPDKDDPAYNELWAVIEYGFIMKYWHRTTNTYLLHFCVDAVFRISMNFTASIEIIAGPTVNPLNNWISLKF